MQTCSICIPQQTGSTSIQIFVWTGGDYNPGYDKTPVSVDIIIGGKFKYGKKS